MRLGPILLFVCALGTNAQTPLGVVTGLATDPSGAAVPSASVVLTNEATGVRRNTTANASGAWSFPDVSPGQYTIKAEAEGFRSIETRPFPVEAYRTVRNDLHFELATATTEVVVTDAAPAAIRTETPAVGS